jgi:hypothetical protein
MSRPDLQKVPSFYHNYINQVQQDNLKEAFEAHLQDFANLLETIPEEKWSHRYAPGKWSIKELVQHVIDAERIFAYRALRFARKDETPLAGFDENTYAAASKADSRSKESLIKELRAVQTSTALLFQGFDDEQLQQSGVSNGKLIEVNAIGFIAVGHTLHHKNILQVRYL